MIPFCYQNVLVNMWMFSERPREWGERAGYRKGSWGGSHSEEGGNSEREDTGEIRREEDGGSGAR